MHLFVAYLSQAAASFSLAGVLLVCYRNTNKRYQQFWSLHFGTFALHQLFAGIAYELSDYGPNSAAHAWRTMASMISVPAGLIHVSFLWAGLRQITQDEDPSPRSLRVPIIAWTLLGITLVAVSYLMPPKERMFWRTVPIFVVTGTAFLFVAIRLIQAPNLRGRVGRRLVVLTFSLWGLNQLHYGVVATGFTFYGITPEHQIYFKYPELVLQGLMGIGIVSWMLEYERIRLAEKSGDLELSEKKLYRSQRMEAVGRFAGNVAHDFNNIMTAIIGYTEVLSKQLDRAHTGQDDLRQIRAISEQASSLTHQLLAFSRKQRLSPSRFDLNRRLNEMKEMLDSVTGDEIDLVFDLEPGACWVNADRGQIELALLNLVFNARDAMAGGGKLTIRSNRVEITPEDSGLVLPDGMYVKLVVSDTGIGIEDETKSRIFEPFFTTKEKGRGTGLGLSTVHGVVRQSGGDVVVHSQPGQGATFAIFLPEVSPPKDLDSDANEDADSTARRSAQHDPSAVTILLVEDNTDVLRVCRRALEEQGYRVLTARDGLDAAQLAQSYSAPIDVLVTDVVMPGLGGMELAERIREQRAGIRILFASGYTGASIMDQGHLGEGVQFLDKPFAPDDLLVALQSILNVTAA